MLFNEELKNKYIIADIPWFCGIFNKICQDLPESSDKILNIQTIKESLKNEIESSQIVKLN
jgi:hypothetical protein